MDSTDNPKPNPKTGLIWVDYGALFLALCFVSLVIWLTWRQYETFQTRAPDLAMFDQAIWNTLHGRFMYSTIKNRSILANHFSPYMVLLSPLFLIWSDGRILYVVQAVGLAVAGLFFFKIVRSKHPRFAFWFLLAFYLNPALHEVALLELRRVTLAVPYLALALYALHRKKRGWMVLGLFLALMCKENIGLLVVMVGIYLLLFERDWKWGLPLVCVGGAWLVSAMLWIIPAFNPPDAPSEYRLLGYFSDYGDSLFSILGGMLKEPGVLLGRIFDVQAIKSLWRVFLPLGLVLPLLAPDWLLISLPSFAYMLSSTEPRMHRLDDWYMASVLPVLFAAIAVGLTRHQKRLVRWVVAGLLITTVFGYWLFSPFPLGGRFDPTDFKLTDRHSMAAAVIKEIPQDASVAAQGPFVSHLAHREYLYFYPWIPEVEQGRVAYLLLDRQAKAYPFGVDELNWEINNRVADPNLVVAMEGDGIYLLQRNAAPLPHFSVDRVAEDSIRLDRVEVAILEEGGFFRPVLNAPVVLHPGQQVRVTLYWEALASPNAERTVSVRIEHGTGELVAQQDGLPSNGARPTSWWETGWSFRDIYYLTVSPQAPFGDGHLDLLLYDTYTQEHVPFENGDDIIKLCDVYLTAD